MPKEELHQMWAINRSEPGCYGPRTITLRGTLLFERWDGPRTVTAIYLGADGLVYWLRSYRGQQYLSEGEVPASENLINRIRAWVSPDKQDKVLAALGVSTHADVGEPVDIEEIKN